MNENKYLMYKAGRYTGVAVATKADADKLVEAKRALGQKWSYKFGHINSEGYFVKG